MRGLYIHIPFCNNICSYCDFPKRVSNNKIKNDYVKRLLEEIDSYNDELKDITTVYIGGGTPNSLSLENLEAILIKIKPFLDFSLENTIELNPELINENLVKILVKYKINRVSIGVQTINTSSLKLLNRNHTKDTVINSINLLKKYGITNINIDLIFGIPNTTINDVKNDLDFFYSLKIPHLSYYSLILEEKTILYYKYNKNEIKLLDDDLIADMYEYIYKSLSNNSYHHYEVSNFSLPGYESIHNMTYWKALEYIGIGSGASGYIKPYRYTNHLDIKGYMNDFIDYKEFISTEEEKKEYMMLGLRMLDGIDINQYSKLFDSNPVEDFKLHDLIENKFLLLLDNRLRIPQDKIFIANIVYERFIKNEKE